MHELRRTTGAFLLQPKIFSLYGIFYYLCKLNCKNAFFTARNSAFRCAMQFTNLYFHRKNNKHHKNKWTKEVL